MAEHGVLEQRRRKRAADEVEAIALTALRERMGDLRGGDALERLAAQVVAGELDPYTAADALVAAL
jgi:LAO/AO transport system kinase